MAQITKIISAFGGQSALADALDTRQSTVAYWVKVGRVSTKWQAKILAAAAERDLQVSPSDFVTVPEAVAVPPLPTARYSGGLVLGSEEIACYVLSDGRRVISRTSATTALSGIKRGGDLKSYVGVSNLAKYLNLNLDEELVEFTLPEVTYKRVFGLTAEVFLSICRAYVAALSDGAPLTARQREIAYKASAFLSACATVGLIALIDEATGYQYERAEDALQVKLRAFLEEEMRPWEKTFPDELWKEFGRLTGWKGSVQHRPKYWGHLVNEIIYNYLDPDVAEWLKVHAPAPRHGQNYHQWLTSQYGLKKLMEHIWMVIGIASTCDSMHTLRYRLGIRFGRQPVQLMMFVDPPGLNLWPAWKNGYGQLWPTLRQRPRKYHLGDMVIDDTSMIWFALRDRRTSLVEKSRLKDSKVRQQTFVAAMAQFEEQIGAAKVVTPATRPLNLYYGLAQAGMAIAAAHGPDQWSFSRHGLKLVDAQPDFMDIQVAPEGDGAFQRVASSTGSSVIDGPVSLGKLWASLPDLLPVSFRGSTDPTPLIVVSDTFQDAPQAQVHVSPPDLPEDLHEQAERLYEIFSVYPGIKDGKIPATLDSIRSPGRPRQAWQVTLEWPPPEMWIQLSEGEKEAFFDKIASEYRYRDDRFARPCVEQEKQPPSTLMTWWLLLYSCSILARYQPRKWTALLDLNKSPSAVPLQYALEEAISVVPHLVLDALDQEPWLLAKALAL